MPRKTVEELRRELSRVCTRFEACKTQEELEEAWNPLRKLLEVAEPPMIEGEMTAQLTGGLYVLRGFVGDVCYNVLNGDSPRHRPLEGQIKAGFRRMTARVQDFIQCMLLGSAEDDPFVKLGEAVREFYSVIAVMDDRTARGGTKGKGA